MNIRSSVLFLALLAAPLAGQGKIKDFQFELQTLGGSKITQKDFEQNVLIVDFWGTWCPPCRAAIPKLVDLYTKYKHQGLEIVGLNYERGGTAQQQVEKVREFAVDQKITYTLALGDEATQKQVPNFRGYPTLLMFKRGLEYDDFHVGFGPGDEAKLEKWIRGALGLDGETKPEAAGEEVAAEEEPEEKPESLEVPEGKIFMPGNGDKGFEFEEEDIDGKSIRFADLRGKPVLLTLMGSWDKEAASTAAFLKKIHGELPDLHVLAAHLELPKDRGERVAAIRKFKEEQGIDYGLFPAGIPFTKKIHRFAGIPLLLLFDAEGTLVLREMGLSGEVQERVTAKCRELAPK